MSVSSGATIAAAWDTQTYLSVAPTNTKGSAFSARRSATPTWRSSRAASPRRAMPPTAQPMAWSSVRRRAASIQSDCSALARKMRAASRRRRRPPSSGPSLVHAIHRDEPSMLDRRGIRESPHPDGGSGSWARRRPARPNAANTTLMAGALAHEFFTPPDPAFAITQFDFDRDPARMEAFSSVFDTYRDATLAEFRKRGGKLLIFHGTADPIFSALESIDYYQRLTRNNGGSESTGSMGPAVPRAWHEPLRGRARDRQLRRTGCDRRLGGERCCAVTHRGIGSSGHDVLPGTDASALCVSLLCPLRRLRQSGRRRELRLRDYRGRTVMTTRRK